MPVRSDSKDIVIVNEKGKVIYCNINSLDFFDLKLENLIGNKVTLWYTNLDDDSSTLMLAVNKNIASTNCVQELNTKGGKIVRQVSNTYPIRDGNKVIGAIEICNYDENKDLIRNKENPDKKYFQHDSKLLEMEDIVGESKEISLIKKKIKKIANLESPVLLCGSTGTGKEMTAQVIHNESKRKNEPFVSVNCAALPENLLEGLLFGVTKGSFTDAKERLGLFEAANKGTLFLDEINSMPLGMQAKLLKSIEEKSIRRVGGNENIQLDVRIIAACNVSSEILLREHHLRDDLYFRLSVIQLDMPKLKCRGEDIVILANYFICKYNKLFNRNVSPLTDDVSKILIKYEWPGNVRELKNTIEGIFSMKKSESNTIDARDLPDRINPTVTNTLCIEEESLQTKHTINLKNLMLEEEKRVLEISIECNKGDLKGVARDLRITQQGLKYKLKKHNLLT